MTWSALLMVYLFSVGGNYLYIHLSHSRGGIFYGDTPKEGEVYLTFIPVLNTIFAIFMWFSQWPLVEIEEPEEDKKPKDYSKFFKIRK